jgi:hypothetical protein
MRIDCLSTDDQHVRAGKEVQVLTLMLQENVENEALSTVMQDNLGAFIELLALVLATHKNDKCALLFCWANASLDSLMMKRGVKIQVCGETMPLEGCHFVHNFIHFF